MEPTIPGSVNLTPFSPKSKRGLLSKSTTIGVLSEHHNRLLDVRERFAKQKPAKFPLLFMANTMHACPLSSNNNNNNKYGRRYDPEPLCQFEDGGRADTAYALR